jgi:hypothetical protein
MKARRANYTVGKDILEKQSVFGVYEHEKLLLEELHGVGNVIEFTSMKTELVGKNDRGMHYRATEKPHVFPVVIIDEEAEYGRLTNKYGMLPNSQQLTTEVVYGRFNMHGLEKFGQDHYKGTDGVPESEWVESQRESSDRGGGWEKKYKLSLINSNRLRAEAKAAGIELGPSETKPSIIEKLCYAGVEIEE